MTEEHTLAQRLRISAHAQEKLFNGGEDVSLADAELMAEAADALDAVRPQAGEPAAFLVERLAGPGYGNPRTVVDAAKYDPRRDDFWCGDAKTRHLVTPLYAAPSQLRAADDPLAAGRVRVPEGQTPLNDKLGHRLLDVFNEGVKSRDSGTRSPYHGHSLEHCLHASGWVQRDLRLALDNACALRKFKLGDRVTKAKGSSWTGHVVGFYSTSLTPVGYAVESENEPGSVQIYPEAALKGGRGDE